ncbi:HAMP domain-containing sensor histidine kinase [Sphingomonas sp.]|uniref:sensor histidine kinase n=1 Tax=Sphingomonas sp. TaxID=28214 RepID=UPI002BBC7CD4|nr:HAMP domain-containing sensor histidine kinase [Sphingomonas sp.]HTG37175.1 HAMP domain-containing sensor histidine kinase [Sphingomonas sp.]
MVHRPAPEEDDPLRFDDTLDTVLAADLDTAFGRQSAYRQLVDLIGRNRVPADARAIETLARIAPQVPLTHRTASARALAFARPPFALVRLFARDELAVAAPVLRTATLDADQWCSLLGELAPPARAILRHRRDLGAQVERALEAFGPVDFVLPDDRLAPPAEANATAVPESAGDDPVATPPPARAIPQTFSSFGAVALTLPVVAQAVRHSEAPPPPPPSEPPPEGPFRIAEVVARIDAFREARERTRPHANDAAPGDADRVRFETDAEGVVRYADGPVRGAMIGLSLRLSNSGIARVDGVAAGAFRQRARFRDAQIRIDGTGPAAGMWLMSAIPAFDPASGRFTGYRGTVRRPHPGETAAPAAAPAPDALRQLVHELRTPTNAIIGFSEMIALEMLGPVADPYRGYADAIQRHARDLLGAIDDLDLAARIESDALSLRSEPVSLRAVLGSVVHDLSPLAEVRGAVVALPDRDASVEGDRHAIERLFGRLMATLLSAMTRAEILTLHLSDDADMVRVSISRPAGLPDGADGACDVSEEEAAFSALPLGTGFALRLAGNLARELGGAMVIGGDSIEIRLPALRSDGERAATNS